MRLYHVSPRINRESIQRAGLTPLYATGKLKVVWACTRKNIEWALTHVIGRHGWQPAGWDVWCIDTPKRPLRRWSKRGIYVNSFVYLPDQLHLCQHFGPVIDAVTGKAGG